MPVEGTISLNERDKVIVCQWLKEAAFEGEAMFQREAAFEKHLAVPGSKYWHKNPTVLNRYNNRLSSNPLSRCTSHSVRRVPSGILAMEKV